LSSVSKPLVPAVIQSILADTLGMAIYPSRDHEASARGAALLALEAMGVIPDISRVAPVLRETTLPNPERSAGGRESAQALPSVVGGLAYALF